MNSTSILFERELKEQVNNRLKDVRDETNDNLADVYFMLSNLKIADKDFNAIIDKINSVKKTIENNFIK
ncbi:MAG: hypothetical protein ACRC6E_00725 [Fusobacteriaceae bacterium]